MVSWPEAERSLSPSKSNRSDLKVICGYFAVSKKSSVFRCLSSLSTPVLTEAVSIEMSALPVFAALSSVILPLVLLKRPRWNE